MGPSGAVCAQFSPLPAVPEGAVRVAVAPLPVAPDDWRLRHKTTDRGFYDFARREGGAFEVVFTRPDGQLTEGSFTSIFVERGGVLLTPPASHGLLPGILRARLLGDGRAVEACLSITDLQSGFFIGNALRGLMPARLQD
jgi:para-aminobenzoate synthetase/4-amino-4-deoxychorismate lyase